MSLEEAVLSFCLVFVFLIGLVIGIMEIVFAFSS